MKSKIEILYEDNHLLVVVKPQNMLTQGDQTGDEDLLSVLKEDLRLRYSKPGNVYLGLVHRLDRPVGGAMVFAKTSKAASRLSEQIRTGSFGKGYLAVIHGVPDKSEDTLIHFLEKEERTNTVSVATRQGEGKKAVLDYTAVASKGGMSLVRVRLHTGRPHQIRVQLSAIGHPIFGDQKYGASLNKPGMQLALWSAEISFEHPTLKNPLAFTSAPPACHPWSIFL